MAGYNTIRGLRVKYLSADPATSEDGQVWYNSTTGNLRVQGIGVGAWSSGTNMSQTRSSTSGAGTQTAGLAIGGYTGVSTNSTGITEEYNGSGWASGGTLNVEAKAIPSTRKLPVVELYHTCPFSEVAGSADKYLTLSPLIVL